MRDLRAADLVVGLPWLDAEQAALQLCTTSFFTPMDGTIMEVQPYDRPLECLLMSYGKVQKLMRKTRRSRGRNAEFCVINVTPAAEQPAELRTRKELTANTSGRKDFRTLLFDDFPELLKLVDSPHVSRQWDHPIQN
jgi:hypothetical protein